MQRSLPLTTKRFLIILSLTHSLVAAAPHLRELLLALCDILTIPLWWALPTHLCHICSTALRVFYRQVTGCPRSRKWGLGVELFVELTRPSPAFRKNWNSCSVPFLRAVTRMDYLCEIIARFRHPRVHITHVDRGYPRPMSWVWFDNTDITRDTPEFVMLYLHGGGHFCLTGRSHLDYVVRLVHAHNASRSLRMSACVVDTRRAPQYPYPAQLDDAMSCYEFLLRTHDASRIILAGDSAGGGLCLSTLKAIRDRQMPSPLCATVISPLTDLARTDYAVTVTECPKDDYIPPEALAYSSRIYAGSEDPQNPLLSPKFGQMHALPPVLIQSGENELLARDSIECARRLEVYRSKVQLEMYPDMPHVFPVLAGFGLQEALAAIQRQSEFVADVAGGGVGGAKGSSQPVRVVVQSSSAGNLQATVNVSTRRLSNIASSPAIATPVRNLLSLRHD